MRQQDPNTLQTKEAGSVVQRWQLCLSHSIHLISTHHQFSEHDSCHFVSNFPKLKLFSPGVNLQRQVRQSASSEAAFEVQKFTR